MDFTFISFCAEDLKKEIGRYYFSHLISFEITFTQKELYVSDYVFIVGGKCIKVVATGENTLCLYH